MTKRRVGKAKLPVEVGELAEFRYRLRRFLGFSEAAAEAVGISAQQYQLLQVVAAAPEGRPATISYIAERMVVRHNSAVELVDRAEKSGLVRRVADASDARRSLVKITGRGGELLALLVEQHLTEIDVEGVEMMRALQVLIARRSEAK